MKGKKKTDGLMPDKKNKSHNTGKIKHSIKWQITCIFVAIMALTIGAGFLANSLLLEKYYLKNKQSVLYNLYDEIKTEYSSGNPSSEKFNLELERYSGMHNVSIVIISSLLEPVKIYSTEPQDVLINRIRTNLFGKITADRIFVENDEYVLIMSKDSRMNTDYIEMWGILPDSGFFLMRTAVESIRNSADIANRFFLYTGFAGMLISAVVIYFFTKRFSKPILALSDISKRMSEMDFEAKYEGHDKNEIALLGANINLMNANLERAITELKSKNLELLKDNEEKEKTDRMRKEFISNVSHELKTPIALIQGYAEGLKEGINEADERDYYCDVIIDEASKMNSMVKKLLMLNQIESGGDTLTIERFDIVSLIKNYISSADIITRQQDIKVTITGPVSCYVWGDEFKIEEVFMNYFSNACNHCKSENLKRIDVNVEKGLNSVKVSVTNTGDNIPQEAMSHLFEKFYKVDKARTREYGGSGVGLSIVKAIVELHNQQYGVYNTEDGVCFWFTLDSDEREGLI